MAAEIMSKVSQMVTEKVLTQTPGGGHIGGQADFSKILSEKMGTPSADTRRLLDTLGIPSQQSMSVQSISAEGLEINPAQVSAKQNITTQNKASDFLVEVNHSALQLDGITDILASDKSLSPRELLGIQAGMGKITISIELATKVATEANSSFKNIMQTGIGG